MQKIRIGIVGYGNIGRGVQSAINQSDDMELIAVFTRRDASTLNVNDPKVKVIHIDNAFNYVNEIDVMILCGGSANDLPTQGPQFAAKFNTVDTFDTHAKIPEYFEKMDESSKMCKKISAISIGWDPGLFSINRMFAEAILPNGENYTFWGKGVSQGHSEALKKVEGVKYGIQYTIPKEDAINKVRLGENPKLTTKERHLRECFIVPEENSNRDKIETTIKNMPNYFEPYETVVHFITEEEFKENHRKMPHGGFVIRTGKTGFSNENNQLYEFSIKLESNPEFTSSIVVAYARAIYRMNKEGIYGAKTVFDIPIGYLSPKSMADLRKELL